ncbi:MAG: hypothetical protein P0120_17260 [Nitrospira sp.]|nr:hypothetical protein [Nitrospira sp.]
MTNLNVMIVQDLTLLHQVELFAGLIAKGSVLINSTFSLEELGIGEFSKSISADQACLLPASNIGVKHIERPIATTHVVWAMESPNHR